MSQQLQDIGTFRGNILGYTLEKAESGAVAVYLEVSVDEAWDEEAQDWADWREHELETSGRIWVIKKDGTINKTQAESLLKCAGWDGSFESIYNGDWKPTPIQFDVEEDAWKDKVRYRISWLNPYDRIPGMGNVGEDEAKSLQSKFGSQLRALAGNQQRNAAPPAKAGGPKKPKAEPTSGQRRKRKPRRKQEDSEYSEPAEDAEAPETDPDEIPF